MTGSQTYWLELFQQINSHRYECKLHRWKGQYDVAFAATYVLALSNGPKFLVFPLRVVSLGLLPFQITPLCSAIDRSVLVMFRNIGLTVTVLLRSQRQREWHQITLCALHFSFYKECLQLGEEIEWQCCYIWERA
jgi:hypothetical protein